MPDNGGTVRKVDDSRRQMREPETSSSINGWTVGQTDRGQRPPYDFCLHIERAPHIIHTYTKYILHIHYICIFFTYVHMYVHMYTLGTALICCRVCSLHRSASLTNFQFELLNYMYMYCMFLYVHMCVHFIFNIGP